NELKLLDVGVHRHKIVRQVVVDIACPLAIDLGRFMQRRRDAPDHAAHILTARRWPETLLTSRISPAEPTSEASPDARARRRQGRTMSTTDEQKPAGYSHDNKSAAGGKAYGEGRPGVAHTAPADKSAGKGKDQTGKTFFIDDREIDIREGETIFLAARRLGIKLPHLCYLPEPGYRPDGNCRICMVEIQGERVLAASCLRMPSSGMKVKTQTDRAKNARRMVAELLVTDQPPQHVAHDPTSELWKIVTQLNIKAGRFPRRNPPAPDRSHPAMAVNLDACIHCNLCVRACREVQVNDVIGMAGRGHTEKIVFDFDDPMGASTCVACGECVQACPTGALMPSTLVDAANVRTQFPDRQVDSVCPYCGVGCQLTYHIKDDKLLYVSGRNGP